MIFGINSFTSMLYWRYLNTFNFLDFKPSQNSRQWRFNCVRCSFNPQCLKRIKNTIPEILIEKTNSSKLLLFQQLYQRKVKKVFTQPFLNLLKWIHYARFVQNSTKVIIFVSWHLKNIDTSWRIHGVMVSILAF